MVRDSLRFNISPLEYFQFGFYKSSDMNKEDWAGTGTMYEYQKKMNPPAARKILEDKRVFYSVYKEFIKHGIVSLDELKADLLQAYRVLHNRSNKLLFKPAKGSCGKVVKLLNRSDMTPPELRDYMIKNKFDLAEEYIIQHPEMCRLSHSGVNTIRIITQLDSKYGFRILGCRLRITVHSVVDNLAAGNIVACIDEKSGIVNSPGFYNDISRGRVNHHPVTGVSIIGFMIPYWDEIISLAEKLAFVDPSNRSVGWDIAVTEGGPDLIEGNHDWCRLVWQLPAQKGLKHLIEHAV